VLSCLSAGIILPFLIIHIYGRAVMGLKNVSGCYASSASETSARHLQRVTQIVASLEMYYIISLFSFLWNNWSRLMRSQCSLCICVSPRTTFGMAKHCVFHKSIPSVCVRLRKIRLIIARQRLCKNVTAATNTPTAIEEMIDASFSMWSASYQEKLVDLFFPELLVIF
jgi:hypothetical protein